MDTAPLGPLTVSRLALGTMLMGGATPVDESHRMLDRFLDAGGTLIDREIGHRGLTELRVVDSMHERKAQMAGLSDAFVAVPGGIGTLE